MTLLTVLFYLFSLKTSVYLSASSPVVVNTHTKKKTRGFVRLVHIEFSAVMHDVMADAFI